MKKIFGILEPLAVVGSISLAEFVEHITLVGDSFTAFCQFVATAWGCYKAYKELSKKEEKKEEFRNLEK